MLLHCSQALAEEVICGLIITDLNTEDARGDPTAQDFGGNFNDGDEFLHILTKDHHGNPNVKDF